MTGALLPLASRKGTSGVQGSAVRQVLSPHLQLEAAVDQLMTLSLVFTSWLPNSQQADGLRTRLVYYLGQLRCSGTA